MRSDPYYEEYEGRRRRPRRRRRGCLSALIGELLKVVCVLVVFALLVAVGLYYLPTSLFMVERQGDMDPVDGLPSSPLNVLVMGADIENSGLQRSDTMIIASIDAGCFRLASLERDMIVPIDGHDPNKLNAAFAFGGPELTVRTVNRQLGTNIVNWIVVDFTSLVRLVDALGGIEIDITEEEMEQINVNVWSSRKVFQPLGYTATELKTYGEKVHLDGLQALGYARIRIIDSDYMRMSRQRRVINAMLSKLRANLWNMPMLGRFVKEAFDAVDTNIPVFALVSLGEKALLSGDFQELRIPVNGSYADNGSHVTVTDWAANREAFYRFAYERGKSE